MILVDTVYQRVLALANKEQRGYVTPQEFNLLANQAQMEIFEQYFYDIKSEDRNLKNSTEFSNVDEILDEKLSVFKASGNITMNANPGEIGTLPSDLYRLGNVYNSFTEVEVEQITESEAMYLQQSPLARPSSTFPAFVRKSFNTIKVYPPIGGCACNYTRFPSEAKWGYVVVNEKALYNPTSSTNFELHKSDEVELVYKILSLAGVAIGKPEAVTAYGEGQSTNLKTQEKQ